MERRRRETGKNPEDDDGVNASGRDCDINGVITAALTAPRSIVCYVCLCDTAERTTAV